MENTESISVVIVDDEEPARSRLRQLLKDQRDFRIVEECANGRQAVASIQKHRPDVAFLDVQMPRMTGFDICHALAPDELPVVVFVTAYDQFALQAFEVHAVDYLLKPFDRERFHNCLQHIRTQVQRGREQPASSDLKALLAEIRGKDKQLERIAVKNEGRVVFVRVDEIDWIEADGNYVHLHAGTTKHFLRETLTALETQLPEQRFMRISRSTIVNVDRIKELQSLFYGDFAVILNNGEKLTLSRTYRDRVESLMGRQK